MSVRKESPENVGLEKSFEVSREFGKAETIEYEEYQWHSTSQEDVGKEHGTWGEAAGRTIG